MNIFFEVIAGIFLVVFLIKLLDPIIIPGLKKFFSYIGKGFDYLFENFGSILIYISKFFFVFFSIAFESFFKGIKLLFTQTIKVLGIIVIAALLIDAIITTIAYPMIYNFDVWFSIYTKSFFEIYTFSFFNGIYLFGLYERIARPVNRRFFFTSGLGDLDDLLRHMFNGQRNTTKKGTGTLFNQKQKNSNTTKKKVYVYDEKTDEYKASE